jgi:hypothetical protein
MGDEQNGQGKSRLDRLEGLMELLIDDHLKFSDEHKRLLTAQVLLTETQQRTERRVGDLVEAQKQLDLKMAELAEAQKDTAERLNALIAVVDDLVRRNPDRLQ